ncbi:MAG TPA: phage minor head protein [Stellaceae bacterium]|nr:phage minor head protein [Stellaceae bacterium]
MTKKLASFFAERAHDVAAQLSRSLGLKKAAEADPAEPDAEHHDDGWKDPALIALALAAVDLGDWTALNEPVAAALQAIFADGVTRGIAVLELRDGETTTNEARAHFGLPPSAGGDAVPSIAVGEQVNSRAVAWAEERAADLVTQIQENTRDMLRGSVAAAIEDGATATELAATIAAGAAFSEARALTIARTEIIRANNQGNLTAYRESGVATGKEWATAHDDRVEFTCAANATAGPIAFDDDFPSGDEAPPAHPNCRCALLPVTEPLPSVD